MESIMSKVFTVSADLPQQAPVALPAGPLFWLALGTFAIGTESFMIAGLLTEIAADLAASIVAVGQLVTVFSFAYALSSPILTALTGALNRRRLMIGVMLAFTAANVLAWSSQTYWALMAARVLLAFSAGLFVPGAHALASAMASPAKRGTALAIVNSGVSIAVAIGVPLGALLGHSLGWRATFLGVAGLSALATLGLWYGLPRGLGHGQGVATLRERLATAREPAVLMNLLVTLLWATGAYTIYTYLALFVAQFTPLHDAQIGYVLFAWGISAAVGVVAGGRFTDRFGARGVIVPCLVVMMAAFVILSMVAWWMPPALRMAPILVAVVAWGLAHWGFFPAQQATLIGIGGPKGTPVVLSLNASFMYLGFSFGSALGSATLAYARAADLGIVGAACELGALLLNLAARRRNASLK
jgi:predicted MFS family arabinose efflux permease